MCFNVLSHSSIQFILLSDGTGRVELYLKSKSEPTLLCNRKHSYTLLNKLNPVDLEGCNYASDYAVRHSSVKSCHFIRLHI